MNELDPKEIWLAILMSCLGGAAHMLQRLKESEYKNAWGPVADMVMAGLAGSLTFFACKYFNLPFWAIGFCTGLAGHAGVRMIKIAESWIAKKAGVEHDQQPKP